MFNLFSPAPQSTADDFCFKWAQGELEDSEFMKIALGGGGEKQFFSWVHSMDREYLDAESEYSHLGELFDSLLS